MFEQPTGIMFDLSAAVQILNSKQARRGNMEHVCGVPQSQHWSCMQVCVCGCGGSARHFSFVSRTTSRIPSCNETDPARKNGWHPNITDSLPGKHAIFR